jgi:prepilin-type N-terminal cleavage/methylation domain-containing protein
VAIDVRQQAGFTLIELMAAISIIGILPAVAIPSYNGYIFEARQLDGREDVYRIMAQQERYFLKNMAYTADLSAPNGLGYSLSLGQLLSPEGLFVMTASLDCDNDAAAAGYIDTPGACVKITAQGINQMSGVTFWLESDGDKSNNL